MFNVLISGSSSFLVVAHKFIPCVASAKSAVYREVIGVILVDVESGQRRHIRAEVFVHICKACGDIDDGDIGVASEYRAHRLNILGYRHLACKVLEHLYRLALRNVFFLLAVIAVIAIFINEEIAAYLEVLAAFLGLDAAGVGDIDSLEA